MLKNWKNNEEKKREEVRVNDFKQQADVTIVRHGESTNTCHRIVYGLASLWSNDNH